MAITLTGANDFLLERELTKLVSVFVAEHGDLALERLDGEEVAFDRLQEAVTSLPFLASKKMVVLRHPGANKEFTAGIEKLLTDLPETTEVVIVEQKLDKRSSYYKTLKAKTDFRDFSELDERGLEQWLVTLAKDSNGVISQADARYLVERVGAHQQLLGRELEKLLLYQPRVTRETIELLTDQTPQSTIFQLLEAVFAGRPQAALALYEEQRSLKVEPPQIIAMIAWQLHVLAILKTAGDRSPEQIAKEAKLNPFVVRKSQAIARKLTLARLKQLIADLVTIDTRSKRESIDLDEALKLYLLKIAG